MVISLFGNLIDLSMIYKITPLRKPNRHSFNDSEDSHDDEKDWMYSFTIHFLNKKEMRITCMDTKEGRKKIKLILDALLKLWTPDQIRIQSIDDNVIKLYYDLRN